MAKEHIIIDGFYIQLFRERYYILAFQFVSRGDNRTSCSFKKVLGKKNLTVPHNDGMRHDIFNPEYVPHGISQRLAVVSLCIGKGHLVESFRWECFCNGRYLLKQIVSQVNKNVDPLPSRKVAAFPSRDCIFLFFSDHSLFMSPPYPELKPATGPRP